MRQKLTTWWWIPCLPLLVCLVACEPHLPDDLPSLIDSMNSNSETTAVAASNKVAKVFGKSGLLQALGTGGPTARTMAATWLGQFPDKDVEDALIGVLTQGDEPYVQISALSTLKRIGTAAALPAIERAMKDPDTSVAGMARDAASTIRARSGGGKG